MASGDKRSANNLGLKLPKKCQGLPTRGVGSWDFRSHHAAAAMDTMWHCLRLDSEHRGNTTEESRGACGPQACSEHWKPTLQRAESLPQTAAQDFEIHISENESDPYLTPYKGKK